ncbi:hypothetical protein Clacol_001070 [Clathrus columnatus]|uniref:RING-type domain-containing protein n=1 Tax=Clathrus columnatus TaxID=1419009 RepID=A0AAV5A0S1_9AGAM|nr:hypothetical protein Clacol_001070 [Clathrus columnatus]
MFSACLSTLKRKFFTMAENEYNEETTVNSACSQRKRVRVQEEASIHETTPTERATSDVASAEEEDTTGEEVDNEETVEELELRVKELEEMNVRDKKKAEQVAARLKKIEEEDMACMICRDVVRNPQLLHCGHSACYRCLRKWWTQPSTRNDGAEVIDTEAESESDINEEVVIRGEPTPAAEDPAPVPEPRPRRRHKFSSVVNRKKLCPYCNEQVTCRPTPDFDLRDIAETLNKEIAPQPSHTQTQRKARVTRRNDLWHGIFHPENESLNAILVTPLELPPGPPPRHPDPILNHFAQTQYRSRIEEIVARRERERAEAYEDGRMRGILETRLRWERAEQARQAAIDQTLQQRGLRPGNPALVPREAPGGEAADIVEIPQDPVPAPPNDAGAP